MKIYRTLFCLVACVTVIAIYLIKTPDDTSGESSAEDLNVMSSQSAKAATGAGGVNLKSSQRKSSASRKQLERPNGLVYEDFVMDPFAIVKSTEHHDWTGIDGLTLENIEKLAHNDIEKARLIKENSWLASRELVYRKETVQDVIQSSLANGSEPTDFVLPGLDGKEYKVIITSVEIDNSDLGESATSSSVAAGIVVGHLEGEPDSEVIIGFENGFESGSLKGSNVELSFDSREDGQFLVTITDSQKLEQFIKENYPNGVISSNKQESLVGETPLDQ